MKFLVFIILFVGFALLYAVDWKVGVGVFVVVNGLDILRWLNDKQ